MLVLSYETVSPRLAGIPAGTGKRCAVLGRVTLGAGASLAESAVIRGDGESIEIGDDFFLGPRATVHIVHGRLGTHVGHRVTVGSNAVVHGCTVGHDCVIDHDAVVLDGGSIDAGSYLAPASVVFPRAALPSGMYCAGIPAAPVRPLEPGELQRLRQAVRGGSASAAHADLASATLQVAGPGYVASTVIGAGSLTVERDASVWFGCSFAAAGRAVAVGALANVQDNTHIEAKTRDVVIGAGAIVGHNVLIVDSTVGADSLVGMGSILAPGTVIEAGVVLAAGAYTTQGQVVETGWLWGGRPARKIAPLSDTLRTVIRESAEIYADYARDFAAQDARPASVAQSRAAE